MVATQLGPTSFYTYLQRFGIGHLTGIDMAGEVNWPLSVQGDPNWYPVNLGTNSFGQGVAATPFQMITAVAAISNNQGKMMAPHILRSVIENGEQYNNPPQVIGTPISAETARTMTDMLSISLEEEASVAFVDGYRIAGKTGTAEIPGPGGHSSSLTNASFVGWGPVDDPRFIVYVWLEKPTASIWGSETAASAVVPELPTVAESGYPGFETAAWQGLVGPAKLPDPILRRVNAEAAKAARDPELKHRLLADGSEAVGNSPEEFRAWATAEIAKWGKVVKAIGVKVD